MSEERDPEVEPEADDNPVEAAEREAGEDAEGGEAYADTAALEQDLADLIGGGQDEPDPAPEPKTEPATDPDAVELAGYAESTEGPSPAEGGALGDGPAPEDNAIPLDTEEADAAAAPSRDADGVPVVDDVVNPAVTPASPTMNSNAWPTTWPPTWSRAWTASSSRRWTTRWSASPRR